MPPSLRASLRVALVALPLALVGGAGVGGPPALLGDGAARLAFRREQLSARHLEQARQHAVEGDASLAWRSLEASYTADRSNARARSRIVSHHLDAALSYEYDRRHEGDPTAPDWTWRIDGELAAALAAVERSTTDPSDPELHADSQEVEEVMEHLGYRRRQRARERRQPPQEPHPPVDTSWLALFPSMVLRRGVASRGWSNAELAEAAMEGMRLSAQHAEGSGGRRQEYAAGTAKSTIANNEFFLWQMEVLRNTSRPWPGLAGVGGWGELTAAMRTAAADWLIGHGVEEGEARRRCATAPLVTWASVHSLGGEHPTHIHDDSTVSGVYFARVPDGAGGIEFSDPRGVSGRSHAQGQSELPRPPFHHSSVVRPSEGELIAFGGWMPHGVEVMASTSDAPRVSISFNLLGGQEPPVTTASHTWEDSAGAGEAVQSAIPAAEMLRLVAWVAAFHLGSAARGPAAGCALAVAAVATLIAAEQRPFADDSQALRGSGRIPAQDHHRDPDALLAMAATAASEVHKRGGELACTTGNASRPFRLRQAAEVLRGGLEHASWQELQASAALYQGCGMWPDANARRAEALRKRLRQARATSGTPAATARDVAAMRRAHALTLSATGDMPSALAQMLLAARNEALAAPAPGGAPGSGFELERLPTFGQYDGDGRLADAHAAGVSGEASDTSLLRTEREHDRLFPIGFTREIFEHREGLTDDGFEDIESVGRADIAATRSTVAAHLPDSSTGVAQPFCRAAVRELCGQDLLAQQATANPAHSEHHAALLECLADRSRVQRLERECLLRGVGRPAVLRGAATRLAAYHRWRTDEAMLAAHGRETLQTVEQEKTPGRSLPSLAMSLAEFLSRYNTSDLFALTLLPPAMAEDASHASAGLIPPGAATTGARLWFSSGATLSVLHKDQLDNVNCVLSGRKRVALVHPRQTELLETERWGSAEPLRWSEAVVSEGDCILIPAGWYHQVATSAERSVAVNQFFERP